MATSMEVRQNLIRLLLSLVLSLAIIAAIIAIDRKFFGPEPFGPPRVQPFSSSDAKKESRRLTIAEKLAMEPRQKFMLDVIDIPGGHPESRFAKELEIQADFDQPLEDLLKAGKYEECSELTNEKNFPADREFEAQGKRKVTFAIFELGVPLGEKEIMSSEIIKGIKRYGYHPATLREMAVFGKELPGIGKDFTLFGLGSVWPLMHSDGAEWCPVGIGIADGGGKPEKERGRKFGIYEGKYDNWVNGYFLGVKMVPGEYIPAEE